MMIFNAVELKKIYEEFVTTEICLCFNVKVKNSSVQRYIYKG